MKQITVSAPGKLLLFGEHAVVYGYPCIVTAVNQRMFVSVSQRDKKELCIIAPDVNIKGYTKDIVDLTKGKTLKEVAFIETAVMLFCKKYNIQSGITITTKSDFSSLFGFGSSSAVVVSTIQALATIFSMKLSKKDLFELSYRVVFTIQKKGSGVDVAAAVYGGTLYFITGGKKIQSLPVSEIPLIVGYSGIKADTVNLLGEVAEKAKLYPQIVKGIHKNIGLLIPHAKKAIEKKDWKTVGALMDFNQGYLESLGVSSQKLSTMIYAARDAGAYGAKLSGAGGGDCMLAVSDRKQERIVTQAIEKAGGEIIPVTTNAKGVKVEL